MELQTLLLLSGMLVLIVIFIALPFNSPLNIDNKNDQDVFPLHAEKERLVDALHELEFDYSLGKIPNDDYLAQRAELIEKGAQVMETLEKQKLKANESERITDLSPVTDEYIDFLISKRRKPHEDLRNGVCNHCGKTIRVSDKYCSTCGKKVAN